MRTPEEPEETQLWSYPDSPEKVLENLRIGYIYRSINNVKNSLDSLNFLFLPDPSLLSGPRGDLYRDWDYRKEIRKTEEFFDVLDLTNPLPVALSFNIDSVDSQPNWIRYRIEYVFSSSLNNGLVLNAKGKSIFTLRESANGLWYIEKWEDFKEDTFLSWAEVKAGDY